VTGRAYSLYGKGEKIHIESYENLKVVCCVKDSGLGSVKCVEFLIS